MLLFHPFRKDHQAILRKDHLAFFSMLLFHPFRKDHQAILRKDHLAFLVCPYSTHSGRTIKLKTLNFPIWVIMPNLGRFFIIIGTV
jgi:hypothetical protein